MTENMDRMDKLEKELAEQRKINEKNTELLAKLTSDPEPHPRSVLGLLKGGKKTPMKKGIVIGVCRSCDTPIRTLGRSEAEHSLCPKCGPLSIDEGLFGRLCADCPHVEGLHKKNQRCDGARALQQMCACVSFSNATDTAIEEREYRVLLDFTRGTYMNFNQQGLRLRQETIPALVFYRAMKMRLLELKGLHKLDTDDARTIAREAERAHAELTFDERERALGLRLARGESSPVAEYEVYQHKLARIRKNGYLDSPEIRELTRKAGDAWGRMTEEQRKNAKRASVVLEEKDTILSIEPAAGLPEELRVLEEEQAGVQAPAPNRMRVVVNNEEEEDEPRVPLSVVFSITRAQYEVLEWGLENATVETGAHKPEDIDELAANLLLPSFMFMLKNLSLAKGRHAKQAASREGQTSAPSPFAEAIERRKRIDSDQLLTAPGKTIPVSDGFGGPVVGKATTRRDAKGNIVAEIEANPEMTKRIMDAINNGGPVSVSSREITLAAGVAKEIAEADRLPRDWRCKNPVCEHVFPSIAGELAPFCPKCGNLTELAVL